MTYVTVTLFLSLFQKPREIKKSVESLQHFVMLRCSVDLLDCELECGELNVIIRKEFERDTNETYAYPN